MSDESSSEERTESPTDRRLEDSRKKGQVPRSREFSLSVMLVTGACGLLMMGGDIGERMYAVLYHGLNMTRAEMLDSNAIFRWMNLAWSEALLSIGPFLLLMCVAAVAGPASIGGWNFSWDALGFKWEKLNLFAGIARIFGTQSWVELLKAMAKVGLIGGFSVAYLWTHSDELLGLTDLPMRAALQQSMDLFFWCFLVTSLGILLLGVVDAPYQIWHYYEKLKMTFQEVKDEHKESEGRPEVKGHIRNKQREMARRRMMAEVPKADVIVTNPTHFAVALKYDQSKMKAPKVIAKGADEVALKIREIAKAHNIMIFEEPPLARALYHTTKLDKEVPNGLYMAVAQVLAYVYQLKSAVAVGRHAKKPIRPQTKVPDDFQKYVVMDKR